MNSTNWVVGRLLVHNAKVALTLEKLKLEEFFIQRSAYKFLESNWGKLG